ncbi:hypothetical protein GQ53DRAFT_834285 [Thozetella sp. PMI_491]|nr:hypothetical protein GQ53DRAFT_834285 [Thozetella sp. PMI_491]
MQRVTGTTLDSLLRQRLVNSSHGLTKRQFLPHGCLEHLLSPDNVRLELSRCFLDPLTVTVLLDRVYDGRRRVFALLVLIDRVECSQNVLDPKIGISDTDLPLDLRQSPSGANSLYRRTAPDAPLGCFCPWKQHEIDSFESKQCTVTSPVFKAAKGGQSPAQYTFSPQTVFPFVRCEPQVECPSVESSEKGPRRGGYGEVTLVGIHPDHHDFTQNDTSTPIRAFALKQLHFRSTRTEFQHEVKMLNRFSVNTHPHLVNLLASWIVEGQNHEVNYFLLFPWAPSDLQEHWEEKIKPPWCIGLTRWIAKQSAGLADGLRRIHNYSGTSVMDSNDGAVCGRHGDIKPENVLVFPDPEEPRGRLVLTDFGLSECNTRDSVSNARVEFHGHRAYEPPEAQIKDRNVSRLWDIWALGCLFLDIIIWGIGGMQMVEVFEENRLSLNCLQEHGISDLIYFCVAGDNVTNITLSIKPVVTQMFSELHSHKVCPQLLHEMLDLIEEHMLVIEDEHHKRASCEREVKTWTLDSVKAWNEWMREHEAPECNRENGVIIVDIHGFHQRSVRNVPIPNSVFRQLAERFYIHKHIEQVISRSDICTFVATELDVGPSQFPGIVYNCQTSNLWKDDLALSATYLQDANFTFAVMYGCTEAAEWAVCDRLRQIAWEGASQASHPMLLPGIFAELERLRLNNEVSKATLGLEAELTRLLDARPRANFDENPTDTWLDTAHLQTGLEAWSDQVGEMIIHLHELTDRHFRPRGTGPLQSVQHTCFASQVNNSTTQRPLAASKRATAKMLEVSRKIEGRLRAVRYELGVGIRGCQVLVEGVKQATNLIIAQNTRRDGGIMRKLAVISIVCLPFMVVTSLFSTQFFNWFPDGYQAIVSPYIWVLLLSASVLSLLGFIGYYYYAGLPSPALRSTQYISIV